MNPFSRRDFLSTAIRGAGACTLGRILGVPTFPNAVTMFQRPAPPPTGSILVLVNLQGGYDALSMLPPTPQNSQPGCYSAYQTARARVNFAPNSPVPLSLNGVPDHGIHPEMTVVRNWFNQGKCAVIMKTGLPYPILSHF